jgi:tetratricopeptide (TPR) repeat protein
MGKRVVYTGCRLLGEELRRLRGIRRIEDIVALSKSDPLRRRIKPISMGTLSQVENAKAMPELETLHTLAVIYQVSLQHLANLMVEERLCKNLALPETKEETEAAFGSALAEGRWYDALTLSIHGERLSPTAKGCVAWRANRASCLHKVGLRVEAMDLLMECSESPLIDDRQRAWIHVNLVEVLLDVGRLAAADLQARAAEPIVLAAGDTVLIQKLHRVRAHLILQLHESGRDTNPARIREAQRLLEQAKRGLSIDDVTRHFLLDLQMAESHRLLGNTQLALRDLRALLRRVEGTNAPLLEARANLYLGTALTRGGAGEKGRPYLEHAASLASRNGHHEEAFRGYLELLKLSLSGGAGTGAMLLHKRCRRLLPLIDRNSLAAREYEALSEARP